MRGRQAVLIAAAGVVGLGVLAPVARAGGGVRFAAPLDGGTVDFGDRVLYRLDGTGCAGTKVTIRVGGGDRPEVAGPTSRAARDPLAPSACLGAAVVPSESEVHASGWNPGDPIDIRVVSKEDEALLRYQRVEVDHGVSVAGNPAFGEPTPRDSRGGMDDHAVAMSTGDVVSIGRVDLTDIYSISLRVCVTTPKPRVTPSLVELRAGAPDAPPIIGPIDVADDVNNSNKANFGWPDCWQLQTWPITNKVPGRAPELYVAMVATAAPVYISYIDFNGTGAVKIPDSPPADPPGTQPIFDGTGFDGWDTTNCKIDDDDSARGEHTNDPTNHAPLVTFGFVGEDGCSMTYTERKLHDVVLRLEYRMQDFGDNGGIFLGNREIQLREAGEYLTGGFLGNVVPDAVTNWAIDSPPSGYPAERIKSNTYPHWSQMEIVQIGSRYIVRINGRTVTDCTTCGPDPGEFDLRIASQPNFSYQYGVGYRMDTGPTNPVLDNPANWGNVHFRNIRVYDCVSPTDSICVGGPGVLR